MRNKIWHYSKTLSAEITVSPQWILSAKNILTDDPNNVPARTFQVVSNIQNFNYMTVLSVQSHEIIDIVEKVQMATHAYMELLWQGNATESQLRNLGFK